MINTEDYNATKNTLRYFNLNLDDDLSKTKLSEKYRKAQAHIDHLTV